MSESNVMAVNFFARKYTFCTGLRVAQYLVEVVEVVEHEGPRRLNVFLQGREDTTRYRGRIRYDIYGN